MPGCLLSGSQGGKECWRLVLSSLMGTVRKSLFSVWQVPVVCFPGNNLPVYGCKDRPNATKVTKEILLFGHTSSQSFSF